MSARRTSHRLKKAALHPRNRHQGHYNLAALARVCPQLKPHIIRPAEGSPTLDFADPQAVTALNRALLLQQYGVRDWATPSGYLCPPVPGRADYIHALADLLGESHDGKIPTGEQLVGLDIGTGANLIYPLLGRVEYQWRFVGADIDSAALANAAQISSVYGQRRHSMRMPTAAQNPPPTDKFCEVGHVLKLCPPCSISVADMVRPD